MLDELWQDEIWTDQNGVTRTLGEMRRDHLINLKRWLERNERSITNAREKQLTRELKRIQLEHWVTDNPLYQAVCNEIGESGKSLVQKLEERVQALEEVAEAAREVIKPVVLEPLHPGHFDSHTLMERDITRGAIKERRVVTLMEAIRRAEERRPVKEATDGMSYGVRPSKKG